MKKQYFFFKNSKPLINEIVHLLPGYYSFSEEELDFIVNYDIKYRMAGRGERGLMRRQVFDPEARGRPLARRLTASWESRHPLAISCLTSPPPRSSAPPAPRRHPRSHAAAAAMLLRIAFHSPLKTPPYSPTWPTTHHHLPRPRTSSIRRPRDWKQPLADDRCLSYRNSPHPSAVTKELAVLRNQLVAALATRLCSLTLPRRPPRRAASSLAVIPQVCIK